MKHVNHILLRVVTHWHVASVKQPEQEKQQQEYKFREGKAGKTGSVCQLLSSLTTSLETSAAVAFMLEMALYLWVYLTVIFDSDVNVRPATEDVRANKAVKMRKNKGL